MNLKKMGTLAVPLLFSVMTYAQTFSAADLARGQKLYMANCIACHNRDPNKKGGVGPELVDAPLSVMTSKVMTGEYPTSLPAGFVPKRKTHAMRKIPKLQKDIPVIHAWVQSMKKKK